MLVKATHIRPPKGFFKANRLRLVDYLKTKLGGVPESCILLKGAEEEYIYDDDQTYAFSQDNHFFWATGVDQPGAYSLINLSSGDCTIYTPKVEEIRKYWERIMEIEEYTQNFEIEGARFLEDLEADLKTKNPPVIYILGGINKYSGRGPLVPNFPWLSQFKVDSSVLYPSLNEVKLIKSEDEIALLKEAARIGSEAHVYTMQNVRPGINETHIQTMHRFYCGMHGPTVQVPYEEICASGKNAAILHYQVNADRIPDGKMVLMDAGAKVNGYNSDITVTYPINGRFTEKQKAIYNICLQAHNEVKNFAKAGVNWQDVHELAEKTIVKGLLELGLIKGGSAEELWQKRISYYFFPHGVGHFIGTYVHDLLGDPAKDNKREVPHQNIRFHRKLEAGNVVTNEPGVYLIDRLIAKAKKTPEVAEYFNFDLIEQYEKEISGVRIEDMLVIRADKAEGLTNVPRTVEEIEKCMAKQAWKTASA